MPITEPDHHPAAALAAMIDHTLLTPTATSEQIITLCEEAVEFGFASVCVPPLHVPLAVQRLYGSQVKVGSVVGFPCGYNSLRQKVQETADLVTAGAEEIDMVPALSHLLENRLDRFEEEIVQLVMAARTARVKVIIECCYLDRTQKVAATRIIMRAGAAFVKTSTGFGPSGALAEDVLLLAQTVQTRIGVKAAGGIRSLQRCREMIAAGATRIGTSSGVTIVGEIATAQIL
ncbi:deoxyribose-phosphate aldolase [Pelovirga terrestris]|uniref:Deoxyribose-phosphate aldolase n=1 Tax=Pelovirga terrestris TaxID=2771352 RepID=A0A8J6QLK8_9BACT|nr:deoxyribose-phosphate aldolase [Pelovirga terrestris]MBD1399382.1 deoxyribose-phosphate aldolase [Pelovirga terrestris]